MRLPGVVLGLLIAAGCSGAPGDPGDSSGAAATDVASADSTGAFDMVRFRHHGDRDDHGGGSRAVHRAIGNAAARLASLQADTIGDNARNGVDDADPDDGGWDFIIAPSATEHTANPSPPNLYGAIGLAAWAAVDSGSAGNRALVAGLDAGLGMQRNPDVDSGPDFVFGPLLGDLADNPGFAAIARAHYDAKRAAHSDAAGLGAFIRDSRHAANQDGLIPYDVGWFVLAAASLDEAFPGNGYDRDADTFAGIVVDDLTSATPDFDFHDPSEGFYGTGLAWAQVAPAWLHDTALLRQVRTQLLSQQLPDGAWGTNAAAPGDDLQVTAHALQTLALTDQSTAQSRRAVRRAAQLLLGAQAASGGWVDSQNNELPLVDADIALGLFLARTDAGDDGLIPNAPFVAQLPGQAVAATAAAPLP